jgi:glucose-1-phosphate adenylyltransferase
MKDTSIGRDATVDKSIVAENCSIGSGVILGTGEAVPNVSKPEIYGFGLVTVGDDSVIPDNVKVGRNTAISGVTVEEDYPNGMLSGGEIIIKAGDRK